MLLQGKRRSRAPGHGRGENDKGIGMDVYEDDTLVKLYAE